MLLRPYVLTSLKYIIRVYIYKCRWLNPSKICCTCLYILVQMTLSIWNLLFMFICISADDFIHWNILYMFICISSDDFIHLKYVIHVHMYCSCVYIVVQIFILIWNSFYIVICICADDFIHLKYVIHVYMY